MEVFARWALARRLVWQVTRQQRSIGARVCGKHRRWRLGVLAAAQWAGDLERWRRHAGQTNRHVSHRSALQWLCLGAVAMQCHRGAIGLDKERSPSTTWHGAGSKIGQSTGSHFCGPLLGQDDVVHDIRGQWDGGGAMTLTIEGDWLDEEGLPTTTAQALCRIALLLPERRCALGFTFSA